MSGTITPSTASQPNSGQAAKHAPPTSLEIGATMNADEFHQLYLAYPDDTRFELIDGVVFMASPLFAPHARITLALATHFGNYLGITEGVDGGDNGSIRLDNLDEVQPDAHLRIKQEFGGQSSLLLNDKGEETYISGAPELVAEVANSSRSIDFGAKLHAYRRSGVREYIVANLRDNEVRWFILADKSEIAPDEHGVMRSNIMPGLWLDPLALMQCNTKRLLELTMQSKESDEHQAFVAKLAQSQKS